jgi:hypothetical protein
MDGVCFASFAGCVQAIADRAGRLDEVGQSRRQIIIRVEQAGGSVA